MAEQGDIGAPAPGPFKRLRNLYRRKPILAWGATAAAAGVIVAVVVIWQFGDSSEPANVAIKCSVYDSDGSVRLTLDSKVTQKEAETGCDSLAAKLSGANSYWRVGAPSLPEEEPHLACALQPPPGESGIAFVETNPSSFTSIGTAICGSLAHEGWTQAEAPTGGPWVHEWRAEQARQIAVEEEEHELAETENAEREERERAVYRCEEKAEAKEEVELEAIESKTKERVAAAPESREYEIEEEGYEREEEAYERREEEDERCESGVEAAIEDGVAEPKGGTEFR